jgi:agmatinase
MKTLEDVLHAKAAVQLGIDAPIYSARYMDEAEAKGILVRTPYEIRRAGWPAILAEAVAHASAPGAGVYLSIDIDAIHQAFAPGTSVPNAQGLLAHEVLDAVFEICAATRVVGMDLVEVSPPLDSDNRTSHLAAQIVFNFIAGTVVRHDREGR